VGRTACTEPHCLYKGALYLPYLRHCGTLCLFVCVRACACKRCRHHFRNSGLIGTVWFQRHTSFRPPAMLLNITGNSDLGESGSFQWHNIHTSFVKSARSWGIHARTPTHTRTHTHKHTHTSARTHTSTHTQAHTHAHTHTHTHTRTCRFKKNACVSAGREVPKVPHEVLYNHGEISLSLSVDFTASIL
jgi:hypothetical protein